MINKLYLTIVNPAKNKGYGNNDFLELWDDDFGHFVIFS